MTIFSSKGVVRERMPAPAAGYETPARPPGKVASNAVHLAESLAMRLGPSTLRKTAATHRATRRDVKLLFRATDATSTKEQQVEAASRMLARGASPNAALGNGCTLASIAQAEANVDLVTVLVTHPDFHPTKRPDWHKPEVQQTVLRQAARELGGSQAAQKAFASYLRKATKPEAYGEDRAGGEPSLLEAAVKAGHPRIVEALIDDVTKGSWTQRVATDKAVSLAMATAEPTRKQLLEALSSPALEAWKTPDPAARAKLLPLALDKALRSTKPDRVLIGELVDAGADMRPYFLGRIERNDLGGFEALLKLASNEQGFLRRDDGLIDAIAHHMIENRKKTDPGEDEAPPSEALHERMLELASLAGSEPTTSAGRAVQNWSKVKSYGYEFPAFD